MTLLETITTELIRKSGVSEFRDEAFREMLAEAINDLYYRLSGENEMASAFKFQMGTPVVFGAGGGSEVAWSMENIANNAGRQSVLYDQGSDATARPHHWRYRFVYQFQATPTVGQQVRNILKTSDGTSADNTDSGNVAVSSINKLLNCFDLAAVLVDQAAANIVTAKSGSIIIPARYFGVIGWNTSGASTKNDTAAIKATFTPYYFVSEAV